MARMRELAIAVLALCGCATGGPGGQADGGTGGEDAALPDGMPVAATWRDDSAADFAMGSFDGTAVESYGALVPAAYYTGGLLWRAANDSTFDSGAAATWAAIQTFPPTGKVAIARTTSLPFGAETPPSVGLTDPDTFSMWFEGEVFLDAGAYTFEMLVDDHGFLELAPPGGAFQRVVSCDFPNPATGTFNAAAAGWYPVRFAGSEGAGEFQLQLRAQGPGLPALQPIPRHRLRAKVNRIDGWFQAGFDDGHLLGDVDTTIDQVAPANVDWGAVNPGDLGITSPEDFSVRWSGQLRIDTPGTYTFRLVTDDGQRLWIDGQKVLDAWDDTTHDQTTTQIALVAGWHDVVVDQTERAGGAAARLSIATGPELAGQPLPLDRLRPVEGRGERWESGVDRADRGIPDGGQTSSAVTLTAPAGATVTSVDVSYTFSHGYWGDLEIRLIAPNGTVALLRDNSGGSTSGTETQRLSRIDLAGAPVAGTWTLRVNDTATQDTGTLLDFQVTPHYAGGELPIAVTSAYESRVRELGRVTSIRRVSWAVRSAQGAQIAVRMRTCDEAAACAAQPWSAPLTDPAGGAPQVEPRRFAQYRVEMMTDGERSPAIESLTIDYTALQ